jgi:putative ABC transport system permease protein
MTPPLLASRLISSCLPQEISEPLLGDLEELFEAEREQHGPARARLRYWWEAVRVVFARRRIVASRASKPFRPAQGDSLMTHLFADLSHAVRLLRRRPGFAALAVLTLALGLGAATGVFSIVNGVLLKSLPYPDPDRLVRIFETAPPAQGGDLRSIAIPTLAAWNAGLRQFEGVALYGPESFDISGGERPDQVSGATATRSLFTVLGVSPRIGRLFADDEERPGGPLVTVLSHRLWLERFGGDEGIVGRPIRLNRQLFTVIGVMPPGFAYPADAMLWVSIGTDHEYDAVGARHMSAIGRIKPQQTLGSATADLLTVEHRLAQSDPKHYAGRGIRLIPLQERLVGGVKPALLILAGAVTLVLLITCVNVANLLLARAAARRREIALRLALGAARSRLVRQLLTESLVLFGLAGALGLGLAALIVRAVQGLGSDVLPRVASVQLDAQVVIFALALAAATGLLSGLLPALQASSPAPASALSEGGRSATGGPRSHRVRSGLIVVETALTAMLLVGAGLLVRSMQRLSNVDPGFATGHILTFGLSLPSTGDPDPASVVTFFERVRERIAAIPGVHGVAMASRLPLSGADHSNSFRLAGEPPGGAAEHSAQDRAVSPGYFIDIGIPVVRGREFTEQDAGGAPPVIMVNESFARRYFGTRDPIGLRVSPTRAGGVERAVVGVARDSRQFGLDAPAEPEFYIPHAQDPWPFLNVAVRVAGDPLRVLPLVQEAVWSLDRELPLADPRTMEQMTAEGSAQRRLATLVLTAFAAMAYLLAAIGLYGVISHAVTQRTTEIGVRIALGATGRGVARLVVGSGLRLVGVGALIGLAAAVPFSYGLRGMLFGVTRTDPVTYLAIALLLPLVAVCASIVPAWRAVRIDPVAAMRGD